MDTSLMQIELNSIETMVSYINVSCVYAFINEQDKKIQVFSTTKGLTHMINSLSKMATSGDYSHPEKMKKDFKKMKLVIIEKIETDSTETVLKIRHSYWIEYFKSLGYSIYSENSPCQYSIETKVLSTGYKKLFGVYLTNRSRKRQGKDILVAVYTKKYEVDAFIEKHYGAGVNDIVDDDESLLKNASEVEKLLKEEY